MAASTALPTSTGATQVPPNPLESFPTDPSGLGRHADHYFLPKLSLQTGWSGRASVGTGQYKRRRSSEPKLPPTERLPPSDGNGSNARREVSNHHTHPSSLPFSTPTAKTASSLKDVRKMLSLSSLVVRALSSSHCSTSALIGIAIVLAGVWNILSASLHASQVTTLRVFSISSSSSSSHVVHHMSLNPDVLSRVDAVARSLRNFRTSSEPEKRLSPGGRQQRNIPGRPTPLQGNSRQRPSNNQVAGSTSSLDTNGLRRPVARKDSATVDQAHRDRRIIQVDRDTFSACLLIKDDNDVLNEFIAYHYHVLKMRYLVVAIDPLSETSPVSILAKWTNITDLNVTIWNDIDYMPREFLLKGYHIPPQMVDGNASASKWHEGYEDPEQVIADQTRINNHRFRQITFLSSCLKHIRKRGGAYTIHIDTDEYVVVNPVLRQKYEDSRREQEDEQRLQSPDDPESRSNASLSFPLTIVPVSEPNAIMSILRQIERKVTLRRSANLPCLSMPRLLFGSEEDMLVNSTDDTNSVVKSLPLETLRWKYHSAYDDVERNAQPKVIVDVSRVRSTDEMFRPKAFSIHRPSKRLCRRIDQLDVTSTSKYPLVVNHYLGTWERYHGRNDTRRSARRYEFKAHVRNGTDTWIQSWYDGFVQAHGAALARRLLFEDV